MKKIVIYMNNREIVFSKTGHITLYVEQPNMMSSALLYKEYRNAPKI